MKKSNAWDIPREIFQGYLDEGMTRKEIASSLKVSKSTIDQIFKRYKLFLNSKDKYYEKRVKFDIHIFDTIDTEEKSYWLGYLYSDGCVSGGDRNMITVVSSLKDIDHIKKFKKFLKDEREGNHILLRTDTIKATGKTYEECSYTVYSKHLKNKLIEYGCTPRKSLTLKFPDEKIFARKELIYDFIRGYVDGDGCITSRRRVKSNRLVISILGTEEFLKGVQKYFPQFVSIYKYNTRENKARYISASSDKGDQVTYQLYEHATIYLSRKYERYAALCRLHNSETSDKIGESCDANAEVTPEIAKGSESTVENSE